MAKRLHLAARLSDAAYLPGISSIQRAVHPWARVLATYDGTDGDVTRRFARDAQAFLASPRRGKAVVVFRGTQSHRDVLDAMDIRRVAVGGGRVHRGFYEQFMSIERDVARDVARLADEAGGELELCLTGHSMGGGIATVAAIHFSSMQADGPRLRITCYTFGAPHMATYDAVRALHDGVDEHIDVHIEGDPVTRVPIHGDFCYPINTLVLTPDGTPSCLIDASNPTTYPEFARMLLYGDPFNTHACRTYIAALAALRHRLRAQSLEINCGSSAGTEQCMSDSAPAPWPMPPPAEPEPAEPEAAPTPAEPKAAPEPAPKPTEPEVAPEPAVAAAAWPPLPVLGAAPTGASKTPAKEPPQRGHFLHRIVWPFTRKGHDST